MIYEVYYLNGQIKDYSANYIADNTLNHFYSAVSSPTMTKAVIDYWRDKYMSVLKDYMCIVKIWGQERPKKTTIGWYLQERWSDGSESWIILKDLKDSYPCDTDKFYKARCIAYELVFAWWVTYTPQKYDIKLS